MSNKRSILRATLFLAAMSVSLTLAGAARAQNASAQFVGKFTLTSPVNWGKSTLSPGTYTLRIDSIGFPVMASISKDNSAFAIRVMSLATSDCRSGSNALRLEFRKGALAVQSLVLADLKTVLIYDQSSALENVEEARANDNMQVLVARK